MKKILLAILIAIFTIGCSDRDDNIIAPEQEVTVNIVIDYINIIDDNLEYAEGQYYYYYINLYDNNKLTLRNDAGEFMYYYVDPSEKIFIKEDQKHHIDKDLGAVTLENTDNRYRIIIDMHEEQFGVPRNVGVYSGYINPKKGTYKVSLTSANFYEIEVSYTIK